MKPVSPGGAVRTARSAASSGDTPQPTLSHNAPMRIVFNVLPALKPKTGVGHYAARLFDALRDQLPPDSLTGFPTGPLAAWVSRLQRGRSGSPPRSGR